MLRNCLFILCLCAFSLFAADIAKLLPAPDIGEPLKPGYLFKNNCYRWSPPECFKDRFAIDYRTYEPNTNTWLW
jgi:hypothetical protein